MTFSVNASLTLMQGVREPDDLIAQNTVDQLLMTANTAASRADDTESEAVSVDLNVASETSSNTTVSVKCVVLCMHCSSEMIGC